MDWEAVLAVEGTPTGDGRLFDLDAIRWRELPLTLLYQPETDSGHDGAFAIGSLQEVTRVSTGKGTANIVGRGVWAESRDDAVLEAIGMIRGGHVTGLSVDVALDLFMLAPFDEGVSLVTEDGEEITADPDADDDGMIDDPDAWLQIENVVTLRVLEATIGAVTVVAFPAFEEGQIAPLEPALAAGAAPAVPPAEWFDDPMLSGPTAMTITPEGRLYGHLAAWGTCHIGQPGCFTAPPSPTGYAMFRLGERETDDGPVAVGQITLDAYHAPMGATAAKTRDYYERTGAAVADIAAGEDEYGIWVAGALRPGLSDEQVIELRGAKLSGDWRNQGQGLDLIGALAVNIPGYPVPRGVFASGASTDEPMALVAAGAIRVATRTARLAGRFTKVRRSVTAAGGGDLGDPRRSPDAPGRAGPTTLAALADRVHAPDFDRLATRAVAPELARLAERV